MNVRLSSALLPVAILSVPATALSQATETATAQGALESVTITASPLRTPLTEAAQPASVLEGEALARRRGASLGATLSGEPSVHDTGFGAGAGRPVIRGFDGPRVGITRNGLDLFDVSALSPDHAVADDPLSSSRIEILRGPTTLPYGGSAIGGLVNLVGDEVPLTRLSGIAGEAGLAVDSGARGRQGAVSLRGGEDGWNWTLGGFARRAGDYGITDSATVGDPASVPGKLPNSATRAEGASVGGSRTALWGVIGLSHSTYDTRYGIPTEEDVFIRMSRQRTELLGEFDGPMPGLELARLRFVDSRYRHDEVEGSGGEVGTSFRNRGRELRVELLHEPVAGVRGAVGVQWRGRELQVSGEEAYLPGSEESMRALFWVGERRLGKLRIELGARHESSRLDPEASAGLPDRSFAMNSASASATLPLAGGYEISLGAGLAARAPVTEELFALGPHAATGTFEIGDPGLAHERSTNVDLALKQTGGVVSWKAGVYANRFRNYVFGRTTDLNADGLADRVDEAGALANDPFEPDAGDFLRLAYGQGRARFHGFEGTISVRPQGSPLALRAFFDLARGRLAEGGDLPRMAPSRVGLNAEWTQGAWSGFVDWVSVRRQDRIAALETPTTGYQRVDAEIARRVRLGGSTEATLFLQGRNLLDQEIRLHTSFVKDEVPMPGRSLIAGLRARF